MPWGIKAYTESPQKFFQRLKIVKSTGIFKRSCEPEKVNFDREGVINVANECNIPIKKLLKKDNRKFARFLDLKPKDIKSYIFYDHSKSAAAVEFPIDVGEEDESDGSDGNTLLMFEVDIGAVIGTAVIGLFA
jgi:hypothetical protein